MSVDRKKILAELKKAKERMGKIRFLKKNSTTHLRILEFEDEEGSIIFARNYVEHKVVDESFSTKGKLCRSQTFGQPCAYCQVDRMAKEEGETSPYRFRNSYLMNGIDIDAPDKRVVIWSVPTTVHNAIAGALLDDDYANVLEAKPGHAFTIKKEGEALETSYETRPMRNPWPVPPALLKQVKDPLKVIDDPGLQAQLDDLGMSQNDLFGDEDLSEFGETPDEKVTEEVEETTEEETEEAEETQEEGLVEDEQNEEEETATTKFPCFGDPDLFDEDSECVECPWFVKCEADVLKKAAKSKSAAKPKFKPKKAAETPKKGRGRPKGSGKQKPAEKTSTKSKASRILGK